MAGLGKSAPLRDIALQTSPAEADAQAAKNGAPSLAYVVFAVIKVKTRKILRLRRKKPALITGGLHSIY
ncbi:hypothetical protein [Bradyrhizobium sp. 15]|uniref:hypothetical protein n=1 Tax=Bradyrhizobium sp. 15 TaxID=2782633 RepID=UPI001FFBD04D|nr:hypothetical protein [Bradyrhizobium sp. 15]MCK1437378.1 hypothetical protein [Bradyrhizobium sp. 15]